VTDNRINNNSQLAGFAKSADLRFLLRRIIGKDYVHLPQLAPTADMLKAYRDGKGEWVAYERDFLALMKQRCVEETVTMDILERGCLLCSEATPEHCHRRLVAKYLRARWPATQVCHLV